MTISLPVIGQLIDIFALSLVENVDIEKLLTVTCHASHRRKNAKTVPRHVETCQQITGDTGSDRDTDRPWSWSRLHSFKSQN